MRSPAAERIGRRSGTAISVASRRVPGGHAGAGKYLGQATAEAHGVPEQARGDASAAEDVGDDLGGA